jgi:ribonuclease P protein subunit RPR2
VDALNKVPSHISAEASPRIFQTNRVESIQAKMAKSKANSKTNPSVPNKHLYSRLSYLHQAAMFLGAQVQDRAPAQAQSHAQAPVQAQDQDIDEGPETAHDHRPVKTQSQPNQEQGGGQGNSGKDKDQRDDDNQTRLKLARHLMTNFRATSLKSQIRVSPAIKHTICKFCDSLLIEGKTSTSLVENRSKGSRKPWADVLVIRCDTCGGVKRFPVQAERQKRRPLREQQNQKKPKGATTRNTTKMVVHNRPADKSASADAAMSVD